MHDSALNAVAGQGEPAESPALDRDQTIGKKIA
jgi:hypothetical protein